VATAWPNESLQVLFCSLLSPLDLFINWDRLCRSMLDLPATGTSRRRLEADFVRPLNSFLIQELGFNPLITEAEGIRIDHQRVHVDAFEFHSAALEGLRQMSLGNHAAAFDRFSRAKSLYEGLYLPGIKGKIIANTRNDLESVYLTAVLDAMPLTRKTWSYSGRNRRAEPGLQYKTPRRPFQTLAYDGEESMYQGLRIL